MSTAMLMSAATPAPAPQPPQLTAREVAVCRELLKGLSNKQIGDHIGIAEATVKVHMKAINQKLGTKNRTATALRLTREPKLLKFGGEA